MLSADEKACHPRHPGRLAPARCRRSMFYVNTCVNSFTVDHDHAYQSDASRPGIRARPASALQPGRACRGDNAEECVRRAGSLPVSHTRYEPAVRLELRCQPLEATAAGPDRIGEDHPDRRSNRQHPRPPDHTRHYAERRHVQLYQEGLLHAGQLGHANSGRINPGGNGDCRAVGDR